jgi:hypothetical protein
MKKRETLLLSALHFVLVGFIAVFVETILRDREGTKLSLIGIVIGLTILLYLLVHISHRIDDIEPRVGVRTTLIDFPQAYREAEKAIRRAKEEILVVSNWTLPYQPNPAAEADRQSYFAKILEKATTGAVAYTRIVQLPPTGGKTMQSFKLLVPHLRECIQKRDERRDRIGLFRCAPSTLISFAVVDGRWVLVQLDEFDDRTKCFQVSKALIIEDSTKEVASVFKGMFEGLMHHSHSMEIADLAEFENLVSTKPESIPGGSA